ASRHDYDKKCCLESLAGLYKRLDRHAEAEPLWQAIATISPTDPAPCIELAKYHEWTTGKLEQALSWTETALLANTARLRSSDQQTTQAEIDKRRTRLLQKLSRL